MRASSQPRPLESTAWSLSRAPQAPAAGVGLCPACNRGCFTGPRKGGAHRGLHAFCLSNAVCCCTHTRLRAAQSRVPACAQGSSALQPRRTHRARSAAAEGAQCLAPATCHMHGAHGRLSCHVVGMWHTLSTRGQAEVVTCAREPPPAAWRRPGSATAGERHGQLDLEQAGAARPWPRGAPGGPHSGAVGQGTSRSHRDGLTGAM